MTKAEILKAKDNDLITELVIEYARLMTNYNQGLGIKRLEQSCITLEFELVARGILTEKNMKTLNS